MKKSNISMLLAGAMTLGLATSALAAGSQEIKQAGDIDVPLKGLVEEDNKLLSVVMPVSIDFTVATKAADSDTVETKGSDNATTTQQSDSHVFKALYSGTGTVTNNSLKQDIKLELVEVSDPQGLLNRMDLALNSDEYTDTTSLKTTKKAGIVLATKIEGRKQESDTSGSSINLQVVTPAKQRQGICTTDGEQYPVNLPAGNYTIGTVMKITASASAGE